MYYDQFTRDRTRKLKKNNKAIKTNTAFNNFFILFLVHDFDLTLSFFFVNINCIKYTLKSMISKTELKFKLEFPIRGVIGLQCIHYCNN